jgi:hypothetical protein
MLNGFHGKVHIKVGPVQMVRLRELDVQQLSDGNIPEPGKLLKRQEKFPPAEEQPEAMLRDVGHFNF